MRIEGMRIFLGATLMTAIAVTPICARAQTAVEATAVGNAIKADLTKGGSSIKARDITVTNVQYEGVFATAEVAVTGFDSPIVFLKKSQGT